ncbi:uncharacterized protein LOC127712462 isoform X2 [Mytilus californianus]|uniref:uncharacterized protein LOC127712462 isoform X2 n=1 Tax=Mytilus californianus TaxID=6549 RepID=UPI002246F2C1|nr:uncharacterized protein LOC127712462 isoform X2 [Mytilus californianus]
MVQNLVCFVLLEILLPQFILSKVHWTISSKNAVFGEDIILTCYLEDISTNPKDCPVRQWSGGPKRMGLVYNGYSSDKNKYEEYINQQSFEFSMIIKNFTEFDINVSYTCSCGFHSSTKNLTLDVNTFHYPQAETITTFSVENNFLRVSLDLLKEYPVPNCSLYIGSNKVPVTYNRQTPLKYNAEYMLKEKDCSEQLELKCTFGNIADPVIFKGNQTYDCSGDKSKPRHLNDATTTVASHKGSTTTTSISVD